MNLAAAPREELIAAIVQLVDENNRLRDQLAGLRRRLEQLQKKPSTDPPLHFKPNVEDKPGEKRQKRTINFGRKRDIPDQVVNHAYRRCPDCGGKLYNSWLKSRRQVIDLPVSAVTVTEHQVFEHWCSVCRKKVSPRLDLAGIALGNHRLSVRLMSMIATLREQCRLPLGVIQTYLSTFHRLQLSEGEITKILDRIAGLADPVHQRFKDQIRGSPVVHGDETGWRENGRNGYLFLRLQQIKVEINRQTRQVIKKH